MREPLVGGGRRRLFGGGGGSGGGGSDGGRNGNGSRRWGSGGSVIRRGRRWRRRRGLRRGGLEGRWRLPRFLGWREISTSLARGGFPALSSPLPLVRTQRDLLPWRLVARRRRCPRFGPLRLGFVHDAAVVVVPIPHSDGQAVLPLVVQEGHVLEVFLRQRKWRPPLPKTLVVGGDVVWPRGGDGEVVWCDVRNVVDEMIDVRVELCGDTGSGGFLRRLCSDRRLSCIGRRVFLGGQSRRHSCSSG